MMQIDLWLADEDATMTLGRELAQGCGGRGRIYLDGNLGAGKTTLAGALLDVLRGQGVQVSLLHVDDYNNRPVQKQLYDSYMEGGFDAAALDRYYRESVDYEALAAAIKSARRDDVTVIVEGVFLYRDGLADLIAAARAS